MMKKKTFIFFTCEHASNAIPMKYKKYFKNKEAVLQTHLGFDHGAKELSKALGKSFDAPVFYGKFSRLLIDLNRSTSHKTLFSEITRPLSNDQKNEIINIYHRPHWNKIEELIADKIKKGFIVIHIGVHSFTPKLFGEVRNAEFGILYHSHKKNESIFAKTWQEKLRRHSMMRVRRNYPYLGKMDGLSTGMRKKFPAQKYLGFEIEVNHSIMTNSKELKAAEKLLISSLKSCFFNSPLIFTNGEP